MEQMKMKVIHLSDLHIGRSNNTENVSRIVEWILEHADQHQARIVVVTGDLTDDGAEWQLQRAAELLEPLEAAGYRVLAVPGNHDYGPFGITESQESVENFQKYLGGGVEYPHLEVVDSTAFVLLDSMQGEVRSIEFIGAEGQLGKEQRRKLDQLLDTLADDPDTDQVVILMHHHPFDLKKFHEMRDAKRFLKIVRRSETPRVTALLFGHKHLDFRFNDPEDHKEDLYGIDLIYAGGSSVERNREGEMIIPVIDLEDLVILRYGVK
jgi:3',5'-cyclic AMP phosphodiesterase CpdA